MMNADFDHFCQLARTRSGLALDGAKAYLVQGRLEPIARAQGLPNVEALLSALRSNAPDSLIARCVDAMATHESLFFRDGTPFAVLADEILPELARSRPPGQPLRIWCAACSSGQEPYSVAMLMQEHAALLAGRRVQIVATDMAETILTKAREGIYSDFETRRGLSPERLRKWFQPRGAAWEISPTLKAMVEFRRHNLLDGTAGLGMFDIVFCRNVLIYFDAAGKTAVLEQIARVLAPGGTLFLGSAETLVGLSRPLPLMAQAKGIIRTAAATSLRA